MKAAASDCCKFLVPRTTRKRMSHRGWGPLVWFRERGSEADNSAVISREVLHWTCDRF